MLALLILAAIVDASLGVLLIALSGFVFGPGPESSNGDPAAVASWTAALIGCLAAPIVGFVLRAYTRAGIGVLVALAPPRDGAVARVGRIPPLLTRTNTYDVRRALADVRLPHHCAIPAADRHRRDRVCSGPSPAACTPLFACSR
jgi:hypothetical protein